MPGQPNPVDYIITLVDYIYKTSCANHLAIAVTKTQENQLKGGKIYLDLQFKRSQSLVDWLHCCGPVARQTIMVRSACWSKSAWVMAARKQREQEHK
jgi:hypothetical protein